MTTRPSAENLLPVLDLIDASDSVELKLTVPDSDIRSTIMGLGLDPIEGQLRQVVFFDTPDLTLNRAGIVVRARRIQGGKGDSVIKLRPIVPEDIPETLREPGGVGIEVDVMPGGHVCSASLKGKTTAGDVLDVILGNAKVKSLFTKDQRTFYEAHAPEGISLDDLSVLGPLTLVKLKFDAQDIDRELVAELWMYPDGSRVLELSTKSLPGEAVEAAAESIDYLERHDVNLGGAQQTKTKTALEYFASLLRDNGEASTTDDGGG